MSLRRALLVPLIMSLIVFGYFSSDVISSGQNLVDQTKLTGQFLLVVGMSIVLQIGGHVVRAYKTRYILLRIKDSSTRFQFRALSIGYLFNTILPFRLGELVRSRIIAGAMNLSFSLAFTLIVLERAIDAVILGVISIILLLIMSGSVTDVNWYLPAGLIVTGALLTGALAVLATPHPKIRKMLYGTSKLFNDKLKNSFRFKSWSVIYGLQKTILKPRIVAQYVCLSLVSWAAYLSSMYVLVVYFFGSTEALLTELYTAIAPYFGVAIPAGPANLGTFSSSIQSVLGDFGGGLEISAVFLLTCWAVLVLPTAVIGLALLLLKTKETFWNRPPQVTSSTSVSLRNKLDRSQDISTEMSVFLENYFAGNTLSTIVHRLELEDNFKLLKYFKGGSDAITILVSQDDNVVVKKIIPLEFEDRLRAQFDWLDSYRNVKGIVQVHGSDKTSSYYTIDMSYDAHDMPFFEYVHSHQFKKTTAVMNETWNILLANVHRDSGKLRSHTRERDAYITKHVYDCLEKAATVDPELLRAAEPEKIRINGREYDNLNVVMEKIKNHRQAWSDIATYSESKRVHGDVIIDNLLVNEKSDNVLIIDPAPDGNIINGKVFDFGKNMQSLYCGYEFLLRDESSVYLRDDNVIDYADASSNQYARLCEYVRRELAPRYLSESEQKAMLFHAGALLIRRLKHQVYYTPGNALKFYAVGVKTLNEFLDQYD